MTKILTSLELLAVVNELKALRGARINKIYLPETRLLLLVLHKPGANYQLKIDSGVGAYLTSYKFEMPQAPQGFCLFLRKHLNNAILDNIIQKDIERIIEFHFQTTQGPRILICELFSKGNFILTDSKYEIINVASIQTWKDRIIKKGEIYQYPPQRFNPLRLDRPQFMQALQNWKSNEIVKLIASGIGLGGIYAEEVCLKAGVDKNKPGDKLDDPEVEKVYLEIQAAIYAVQKNPDAQVIYEDSQIVDATPFKLELYKNEINKPAGSFNQALDVLYSQEAIARFKAEKSTVFDQKRQQLQTILDTQKRSLEQYKVEYIHNQKLAESIYNNYQLISNIFNKIKSARDAGYKLEEIHQVLENEKAQGVYEARMVRDIIPETNAIILNIDKELSLDLAKSIEQNAGDYYENAKHLKSKIEGAQNTVKRTEKEIEELTAGRSEFEQKLEKQLPKPIKKVEKKWYENFRWFFTSSGLLAVGGRDATSNDILVKKYLEVGDIIFHTELPGSPFFIIKGGREKSTDKDREEVANATASFSRAWRTGVGTAEVYWILPEQVTKEYGLQRGSFMIRGKRNYNRNAILEVSVGVDSESKIMSGPKSAISKRCQKSATVRPGQEKTSDVAKKIAQKLELKDQLNEIIASLPAGGSYIQKPTHPARL